MTTALRILVIDDEERVRTVLQSELEEDGAKDGDGPEWEVRCQGFRDVEESLIRFRPDMVVLDLVEGEIPDGKDSGNQSFEQIRDVWFCPVIVYTGFGERRTFEDHQQVVQVTKGSGSEAQVVERLLKFVPLARMIRSVHEDFDGRIREALRDSVDALHSQIAGNAELADTVLSRAVRRQVAARVDLAASVAGLRAWERLVVPPLGDDLLTADLLRLRDAEPTNAAAFRMVLTPSCDMVGSGDRTPSADRVLVAKCEPLKKLGKVEFISGKPLSKGKKDSLRSILNEGTAGQHLVVPEFRGHVPLMAVNLKRLELIEWDRVDLPRNGDNGGDKVSREVDFKRVASTDSPFREMVTWAYLRVTGRPGVPEIDVEGWLDDISRYLEDEGSA